jgi:hypothetical protein
MVVAYIEAKMLSFIEIIFLGKRNNNVKTLIENEKFNVFVALV